MVLCIDCEKRDSVSREGWCRPCLRKRLTEKFGSAGYGHVGTSRTASQRQAREYEPNPWQENAIRAMEN